jgi:NitT/TauT family transport system ATP-binding protein
MTLQEELTRIWQAKRPTVIFITHDVAEAVFLADRVGRALEGPRAGRDRGRPAAPALVGRAARGRAFKALTGRVLQLVRSA